MTAFEVMQKYYKERDLGARDWKKRTGGKVVGFASILCPEELIMAAGLLGVIITGDPQGSSEAADKHMEYFFTPDVRSLYNELLIGKYDFADILIMPASADAIARMCYYLWEEKDINPNLKIPAASNIWFHDWAAPKFKSHRDFNRGRMFALKEKLEEFCGKKITDKALTQAIAVTNENRMLLQKIAELRRESPPRLCGTEALQIIMPSMLIPKEEHNKLLRRFLEEEVDARPTQHADKVRILKKVKSSK